jgi:hypothetical protein
MWQLVFASRHRLIRNNNNKNNNHPKGCVMVMADPSDIGHGKKGENIEIQQQGHMHPLVINQYKIDQKFTVSHMSLIFPYVVLAKYTTRVQ